MKKITKKDFGTFCQLRKQETPGQPNTSVEKYADKFRISAWNIESKKISGTYYLNTLEYDENMLISVNANLGKFTIEFTNDIVVFNPEEMYLQSDTFILENKQKTNCRMTEEGIELL